MRRAQRILRVISILKESQSIGTLLVSCKFANIFVPETHKNRDLFNVELQAGEWKVSDGGMEEEAPILLLTKQFSGQAADWGEC